jgi:hypothetical protein
MVNDMAREAVTRMGEAVEPMMAALSESITTTLSNKLGKEMDGSEISAAVSALIMDGDGAELTQEMLSSL